jgi:phi13 family phage major tail protein
MPGTVIGLTNLYYATLTTDPIGTGKPTYGTPVRIPGVISATINPNASKGTLFADNGPMDTATALGLIDLELNVVDVPFDVQAALLGHTITTKGVMTRKSSDVPPWVAIGFETLKSNGKKRFVWLVKGKFSEPEQKSETQNDGVNFQTPTIAGSFVRRDNDQIWELHADEDATGYVATVGTGWFTTVFDPTAA